MRGLQYGVMGALDQLLFLLCSRPPEDEDDRVGASIEGSNHLVRESLPAFVSMRECLVRSDGENGVEQQHSLAGPPKEIRAHRVERDSQVGLEFFEDVLQARRFGLEGIGHSEAQPDRLSVSVVGILPQNHDAHFLIRDCVQSAEDPLTRRVDPGPRSTLLVEEAHQLGEVGLTDFVLEDGMPSGREVHVGQSSAA